MIILMKRKTGVLYLLLFSLANVFGDNAEIDISRKVCFDFFLLGTFMIISLYHLTLFGLRRKNRPPLFFGLFCIILSVRLAFTGEKAAYLFFNSNWLQDLKIDHLTFYLAVPIFGLYVY